MSAYKILISACLLAQRVRYDAKVIPVTEPLIQQWLAQDILLSICPEVCGGLPTPRAPAEIQNGNLISTQTGSDVTQAFKVGAQEALDLALQHNIKIAILTEKSPSCGSALIYDGQFSRKLISGEGVTTKLLRENGIQVFNQFQLQQVAALISAPENR